MLGFSGGKDKIVVGVFLIALALFLFLYNEFYVAPLYKKSGTYYPFIRDIMLASPVILLVMGLFYILIYYLSPKKTEQSTTGVAQAL
jgi:uncharacterized membrane protein